MNKIAVYLNKQISGNVFDKDSILEAYSTDRSPLKIKPKYLAFPESTEDVQKLLKFIDQLAAKDFNIPIGIWGSGLDASGADLTTGLLISTEKLNRIKEIDAHDRLIHVQSGLTLGQLNSALSTHGLILPINANPKETIGSLIANCPTDSFAAHYGGIMNYVERVEVVLADGTCIQTAPFKKSTVTKKEATDDLEGKIYRETKNLYFKNENLMQSLATTQNLAGFPSISRCYDSERKTFDLLPLFYGSQGTLGVITEIILRVEPIPTSPTFILSIFNSIESAANFLSIAKRLNPVELLIYDTEILNNSEEQGKKLFSFSKRIPKRGYLIQSSFVFNAFNKSKIQNCLNFVPKSSRLELEKNKSTHSLDCLSSPLLAYLNESSNSERTPIVDNVHIPGSELPNFIKNLEFLEKKYKIRLPIFGSYATNIYSIRPEIKIETEEGRTFIIELLRDINVLLKLHHGHLAGGTPEGRLKALITNNKLSKKEKDLYKAIKATFDAHNILSPDIKLNANPRTTSTHFRTFVTKTIQY